jgi:hypothetical protein
MQVMKYSTKGIGSLFKFQMEDILGYPEGAGF